MMHKASTASSFGKVSGSFKHRIKMLVYRVNHIPPVAQDGFSSLNVRNTATVVV